MNPLEVLQIAFYSLAILGIMFGVYKYFRTPQEKSYTTERLMAERINQFAEQLQVFNKDLVNLRDNHIHSLDIKIDGVKDTIAHQAVEIGKLTTIIDERIPKKG